jgi:hypothetical protein
MGPTPHPWYYDIGAWLNLSPVTKKKLHDSDPTVCHTFECTQARLAAGIEYMGYKPYRVPTPGLIPPVYTPVPMPRFYTPAVPAPQPWRSQMLIYCRSSNKAVTRAECPDT